MGIRSAVNSGLSAVAEFGFSWACTRPADTAIPIITTTDIAQICKHWNNEFRFSNLVRAARFDFPSKESSGLVRVVIPLPT